MPRDFANKDLKILESIPTHDRPNPYLKACIYGDAGQHKTVTSCSIGKTFELAADPGWVSIENHPEIWANTTVKPFVGFKQLEALSLAFYHQKPPYDQYDTVNIDTLAFIQEYVIDTLLRAGTFTKGRNSTNSRPQFEVSDQIAARELPINELPGLDDYHHAKNVLRGPLRTLMLAPVNVIIIAHEREPTKEDQKNNLKVLRPDITETLYRVIFRDLSLVGRTFTTKDGERCIDFRGNNLQAGKSRITSLDGKAIKAEDFPKYIKKWQGDFAKWDVPSFATK